MRHKKRIRHFLESLKGCRSVSPFLRIATVSSAAWANLMHDGEVASFPDIEERKDKGMNATLAATAAYHQTPCKLAGGRREGVKNIFLLRPIRRGFASIFFPFFPRPLL